MFKQLINRTETLEEQVNCLTDKLKKVIDLLNTISPISNPIESVGKKKVRILANSLTEKINILPDYRDYISIKDFLIKNYQLFCDIILKIFMLYLDNNELKIDDVLWCITYIEITLKEKQKSGKEYPAFFGEYLQFLGELKINILRISKPQFNDLVLSLPLLKYRNIFDNL